ncbi:protein of unknown function [Methylococcus capsulatus]|uniref:Uncharacterized protein n=1 Tax=Methylococcus capsulatus TaxID=414 RepID=A0AA35XZH4_METCP|nr:protein of unknown function [Methylococcus capsulatus]
MDERRMLVMAGLPLGSVREGLRSGRIQV